ncbi:hypothetical protein [uncultured Sphingomonas sp.]|uniref:hypothetical protein n=1 Tax=uncultured Sphingomonas sp. TaxID=158754 RepID=UPI0025ED6B28|nr:hypothetical protein [uncultured Sphingomonas sp.]
MTIAIVEAEIARFLASRDEEVLCISGDWGIGKTYAWKEYLKAAERSGAIGLERYAYVSLFGLNSLGDLRNAITENTVVTRDAEAVPDVAGLRKRLRKAEKWIRKSRPLIEIASASFRIKDAGDALYRAAFLGVRSQIVCFDDLERAGETLKMRDILGLASLLREERKCKVVLLLNKERVDEAAQKVLQQQLEKVVDTFLVFNPTSAEAISITIKGTDPVSATLARSLLSLRIRNIRVIKKVERLTGQLVAALDGFDQRVIDQAISTLALAGWSFFQPDDAPSTEFLRSFNQFSGLMGKKDAEPSIQATWRTVLRDYGYGSTDELDAAIIAGVQTGYFVDTEVRAGAEIVSRRLQDQGKDSSFSEAWSLYHRKFNVPDDVVLDAMEKGIEENLSSLTPANMNAGVRFLRRYGRDIRASELIKQYIDENAHTPNFFSRQNRLFFDDPVDPQLLSRLEQGRTALLGARDPATVLKNMATNKDFDPERDLPLFSALTIAQLVQLLDDHAGEEIKGMAEWLARLARQPGGEALLKKVEAAFAIMAARSRMRADRLRSWSLLPAEQVESTPAKPSRRRRRSAWRIDLRRLHRNGGALSRSGGRKKR